MSFHTQRSLGKLLCLIVLLTAGACASFYEPLDHFEEIIPTTIMEAPAPDPELVAKYDPKQIERGKNLVGMLGCGTCHTNGALIGEPDMTRRLAGSRIGIAYSNPLKDKKPGVVYAPNLTPDKNTGLGSWNDAQVAQMIRQGTDRFGHRKLFVMPWPAYTQMMDEDAYAIVAYLRSLPAIEHQVPDNVKPGHEALEPYVHFGVYRSRQ